MDMTEVESYMREGITDNFVNYLVRSSIFEWWVNPEISRTTYWQTWHVFSLVDVSKLQNDKIYTKY